MRVRLIFSFVAIFSYFTTLSFGAKNAGPIVLTLTGYWLWRLWKESQVEDERETIVETGQYPAVLR